MRRRTFDGIMSTGGFVLTIVLLVAGGLLMWGYSFANSSVHDQLAAQQIFFPPKGSDALKPPEIGQYLNKYAGQQLTNGAQAEAYANHFILRRGAASNRRCSEIGQQCERLTSQRV
jgi:hypothetical protein